MTSDTLLTELDAAVAFQAKWRRVMSVAHTSMSAVAIVASGAATVVAASGYAWQAGILAAIATVSFGTEKALMLREKWLHHLMTASQLSALRLELKYGGLDEKTAAERMGQLMEAYAGGLPVSAQSEALEQNELG